MGLSALLGGIVAMATHLTERLLAHSGHFQQQQEPAPAESGTEATGPNSQTPDGQVAPQQTPQDNAGAEATGSGSEPANNQLQSSPNTPTEAVPQQAPQAEQPASPATDANPLPGDGISVLGLLIVGPLLLALLRRQIHR
jgi:hypothetical protein